jgi:hypothetical protein
MCKKIKLGTRSAGVWCNDLTGHDIAGQDESRRAMPNVFKFTALDFAWRQR